MNWTILPQGFWKQGSVTEEKRVKPRLLHPLSYSTLADRIRHQTAGVLYSQLMNWEIQITKAVIKIHNMKELLNGEEVLGYLE